MNRITVIPGDGIGPEVIKAAQRVIEAADVMVLWDECEAGAAVFRRGVPSGVPQETIDSIRRNRIVLKGPLETPVGFGEKSANVTLRKLFETYGNIRPIREMPGVTTPFSGRGVDLVVVRENVEDLYAGIEHMQTPGVAQCLKLTSKKGCEKVVRLAFEVAVAEGRRKVHCATKANIMKFTEGLLKSTFEEVAREYPQIEAHHILVDNCAHQLVRNPEQFDVIVTGNMNGDILSDLTSGLIGGLGFAPGANIGSEVAIFEAVHGTAPGVAGQNLANPTAVILSAVMLLRHINMLAAAESIENALLRTLEQGVHTKDAQSKDWVGTTQFTDAVIANLGRRPQSVRVRDTAKLNLPEVSPARDFVQAQTRRTIGVDIFLESAQSPSELGQSLESICEGTPLRLKMISNRGTKVYPDVGAMTDCVDHWRCRFVLREQGDLQDPILLQLLAAVAARYRWMHTEKLMEFNGKPAYTRAQGED
jgi:isocitrate dehydrogenase